MLVLSRKVHEKLLLPTINASIAVVAVKPGVVRLGFEAPEGVPIFREEIFDPERWKAEQEAKLSLEEKLGKLQHLIRNRLNAPMVGLALLRRQLELGMDGPARETLDRVEKEMQTLRERIEEVGAAPAPPPAPVSRRRALLVEDDKNECELLAGFLRLAGLEVDTAGDGADALDYLRQGRRPDVVLLDMVMPRCDGPSTVKEIRRDPSLGGLKIFGVTGLSPERFGLEPGPGGVDGWFSKPLNPEALLRALQAQLSERGA